MGLQCLVCGTLCTLRSIISNVFFEDTIIDQDYLLDISSNYFSLKNPDMVVILLASKKAQIWLLSCWHPKKPKYSCCPTGIQKSLDMVVTLLTP